RPPVLAGPGLDAGRRGRQLVGGGPGLGHGLLHPLVVGLLKARGMPHGALGRRRGHPLGDQEVPGVPIGHVDHVAGNPELLDGPLEDDLHRAVYGSRAISRAFLTAEATSRWCWAQFPVTRRARSFPRSETNFRSRVTSL